MLLNFDFLLEFNREILLLIKLFRKFVKFFCCKFKEYKLKILEDINIYTFYSSLKIIFKFCFVDIKRLFIEYLYISYFHKWKYNIDSEYSDTIFNLALPLSWSGISIHSFLEVSFLKYPPSASPISRNERRCRNSCVIPSQTHFFVEEFAWRLTTLKFDWFQPSRSKF